MNAVRTFLKSGELPEDYGDQVALGRELWTLEGKLTFERHYYNTFGNIRKREPSRRQVLHTMRLYTLALQLTLRSDIQQDLAIPSNWLPAYVDDTSLMWMLSSIFAVPTFYDAGLTRTEISFLAAQDQGKQTLFREYADLIAGDYPPEIVNALHDFAATGNVSAPLLAPTPENSLLHANPAALRLAIAFYQQAIDATPPDPPLMGQFIMTRTGLDLVDKLPYDHLRLIIKPGGVWLSVIYQQDGHTTYSPGFWSPDFDNLMHVFRLKHSWIFRVMLACLWRDARTIEYAQQSMRRANERNQTTTVENRQGQIVYIPRRVSLLTWEDGIPHTRKTRTDYTVRAHYRKLTPEQVASEEAINNALDYLFPAPPPGYTFVQPYTVGQPPADRPRLVAKGLQAARVALARL